MIVSAIGSSLCDTGSSNLADLRQYKSQWEVDKQGKRSR